MENEAFEQFVRRVEQLDLGEGTGKTTSHTSAVSQAWSQVLAEEPVDLSDGAPTGEVK